MSPNETGKRAEEIRRRRSQQSQQRINSVSRRVMNPVNPRPVVVRGSSFGTPIHRQAGSRGQPRRQFYITMDSATGTELRLPPISLVNPGWRMLSGLLAVLAVIGIYSMMNSPFFRINMLDVRGLQRVSAEDLSAVLDLENLPIIEVDRADVQEKVVEAFPELINVQVTVELPNNVTISASERQPVLAWQKGDTLRWVDADGVVFPARGELTKPSAETEAEGADTDAAASETMALITIHSEDNLPAPPLAAATPAEGSDETGAALTEMKKGSQADPAAPRRVDPDLLKAAQTLAQKLPAETSLVYEQHNGLGWNDPQGWQVFIGRDLSDFDAKYGMYQQIANALTDQGLKPVLISVEQLGAPFYRLEQ